MNANIMNTQIFYLYKYELILIKIYMNANIMNTQISYCNKYDLKGH